MAALAATQPGLYLPAGRADEGGARVEQALELARHDATRRQRATIDPAGLLLLGIVEVEGMAARVLLDVGVQPDEIRAALQDPR